MCQFHLQGSQSLQLILTKTQSPALFSLFSAGPTPLLVTLLGPLWTSLGFLGPFTFLRCHASSAPPGLGDFFSVRPQNPLTGETSPTPSIGWCTTQVPTISIFHQHLLTPAAACLFQFIIWTRPSTHQTAAPSHPPDIPTPVPGGAMCTAGMARWGSVFHHHIGYHCTHSSCSIAIKHAL